MAISRMQQPRQMQGLGSFVKKLTRKVTRPFTKVAKKLVPKEIAGIMRVAAPFLPPQFRAAAYLLGTAKQTGRISPVDLALTLAPRIGKMKVGESGQTISQRLGALDVPFTDKSLGEVLVGSPKIEGINESIQASPMGRTTVIEGVGAKDATSGLFGKGGEMFQFGKEGGPGIFDTQVGRTLFGKEKDGKFVPSFTKIGSIGAGILTAVTTAKTPDEAGEALVAQTGNSEDYEAGKELFSQLKTGVFDIPERFRLPSANGGLMRTNYAIGSEDPKPVNPFAPKPTGPILPEEDKPFRPKPLKPLKMSEDDDKGIMMMAGSDRYQRILEQLINELEDQLGRELTDAEYDMVGRMAYERLSDPDFAVGGRVDYALGTKPTAEESGLGGLPIEADMRYTGGFMPYGAKEKADDVPARLSKNEFVFTADAVRAAGGGSVNKGAKKMYQTMKQLEAKPEAKGMTA